MAKKEDQTTPEMLEEERQRNLVIKCRRLTAQAAENRRKFDWEWLVRILYKKGYHFARYNRATSTVVFSTRTGVRIPINLVAAHTRGVRNQVTSFQPKWEVLPNVTTESAFENARYSGKTLDYIYDKSQIKRKIKEAVDDCLWSSIGIWFFDVDRKKNVVISRLDPFDVYIDPNVKSPDLNDPEYGAEFVTLKQQMPIDAIKKNPEYENTEDLTADNFVAAAEYKRFLLQVTTHQVQGQAGENDTKILSQTWLRERDEKGDIKLKLITYVDGVDLPLKEEELDDPEYPIKILQGDISPGSLYGESWIKHLIPINRVIDALESHIFEYNHFFAKGRFVVDKNSGVRVIVNQHGQIIEKNRGSQVTSLPISPLPPSPQEQISNMRKYLEDISGVHDVSLGRLPGTIRSGTAIAELRQSDATNQSDLVDNLEDFLSRSGRKMLKLVAENWNTSKLISVTGLGGKPDYFMAIGEKGNIDKETNKFTFGEMKLPLAIIGADNEVRVQVGSWLDHTKEARLEKLKELFRLGAIDQKTYLEHAEFADIDGIVERTRDEALLQSKRGQAGRSTEREFGVQLDDESLALAENEMMLEGVDQPVYPDDDHEIHLSVHKEQAENDLVKAHMNEHITQMRWMQSMESQPIGAGGAGVSTGDMGEGMPGAEPTTFPMLPPQGAGAPPFNPNMDIIQGGGF